MMRRARPKGTTGLLRTGVVALSALVLSVVAPLADAVPSAVADDTGPHYFGSLKTSTVRATSEAPTMKLAMVEMNWRTAQADDADPSTWDMDYFADIRTQINTFKAAGRRVVLGLGIHYEPTWVLELSRMRNQTGAENTTNANIAFSQAVRSAVNDYLAQIDAQVGVDDLWGIRINVTSNAGEVQYPTDDFWAYSTGAQNGADKPLNLAPNPFPGWKAGTGDASLSVTQVEQWARWYQGALANAMDEQMDTLTAAGFHGYYFPVTAGGGLRPTRWNALIGAELATVATNGVGRGIAWDAFYDALEPRANVVAYSSSTAEKSTSANSCLSSDNTVAISSSSADSWPAARWMARVAHEHGHLVAGENPGYSSGISTYYKDPSSAGMMSQSFDIVDSCGFLAFFWAHDDQLWDGTNHPDTSYARYAALINDVNADSNPAPPFPS